MSKIAKKVRSLTELVGFAEYVDSAAIITRVTAHLFTAEDGESTRTYEPREGLTEEDYRRLAYDVLSREALACLARGLGREGT